MSETQVFTLGAVLNVLLTNTNCRSSYLANHYVYKDASLVSKWLHDTQFPTPDVFPLIVRFAMEKSNAGTRSIMRIEIDRRMSHAGLDDAMKQALVAITDFDSYLLAVLNVLANLRKAERVPAARANGPAEEGLPTRPGGPPGTLPVADGGGLSQPDLPVGPALNRPAVAAAEIVYAALSALCGETLWRLVAAAFRLSPVPGALGGVAGGWGFAWGVALTLPAMGLALLSLGRKSAFVGTLTTARKLAFLGCYCGAGGVAGLLLGSAGLFTASPLRSTPPLVLVSLCSLMLSFLPLLFVYALLRRPKFDTVTFLTLEFGPCLICSFIALPFMLQPSSRQAGDIFAGFVLGLLMYACVRTVLQSHPGRIRFRILGPNGEQDL